MVLNNFGNFRLTSITGTKYEDHNGSGTRNQPPDQGLNGWVIRLERSDMPPKTLKQILGQLSAKNYAGPLSVELFLPKFQQGDPFEVAREIRQKAEVVMRQAKVM